MAKTFSLEEKIFHFQDIAVSELVKNFPRYLGKKSIIGMNIPLLHKLKIPFIENHSFYAIRIVPYFHRWDIRFSIPTVLVHGNETDEWESFLLENNQCTIKGTYDKVHPWYKITEFYATYEYVVSLFENIFLKIQVSENLVENPLDQIDQYYFSEISGYTVMKDGVTSNKDILPNKSYFLLSLDSIILNTDFVSYNRTAFFSVMYPCYKSMLLTSVIPTLKPIKSRLPGITYDGSFYEKHGVPVSRPFCCTLQFSWAFHEWS